MRRAVWGCVVFVALACGKAESRVGAPEGVAGSGVAGSTDAVLAAGASSIGGASGGAGGAASGGERESAGSVGVADGGQATGGSASAGTAGMGGIGNVMMGAVTPGTCGIARRIQVPSIDAGTPLRREAGGFVAGPWPETRNADSSLSVAWLTTDGSGEKQTLFRATAPPATGGFDVIHFGPADQALAFFATTLGTGPADFSGTLVKVGATSGSPFIKLFKLDSYWQRVGFMGAATALDGQRAVVAAGSNPDYAVAVVAVDGSVVGTPRPLTSEGATCRALQPTDHAAAFSVVENREVFHRWELSAAGDIAWEVNVPLHPARPRDWNASSLPCPLLALTPDGIALLVYETVADVEAWHLHRLGRDGTSSDESWDMVYDLPRGFAIQGSTQFAITVRNGVPANIVKRSGGQDQKFAIDAQLTVAGSDGPFASEAGSLFVDVRPTGDVRQILELTCP